MRKSIALDLDGVVTDISSAMVARFPDLDDIQVSECLFTSSNPPEFDEMFSDPLFWRNMKPIKESWHLINKWFYSGFDIFFVTARRSDASIGEMERWLDGWRIPFTKIYVTNMFEKSEVISSILPLVFVDDNPFEIEKMEKINIKNTNLFFYQTWYNEFLTNKLPFITSLSDIENR